jgi:anthranilate/para-aminobenzoate synthase component I
MSWKLSDLEANPVMVARALSHRPGVALIYAEGGRVSYVASDPIAISHELDPEPALERRPGEADGGVPRWIGLIPYEACRAHELEGAIDTRGEPFVTRPLWLRYGALVRIAGERIEIVGEDAGQVHALRERLARPAEGTPVSVRKRSAFEPEAEHAARIRRALAHIARGDIYEINLARRFELEVRGAPWDVLWAQRAPGLPPHSFALRFGDLDVIAASPELCLRLEADGRASTSPIKGTRPRGASPEEDRRLAAELDADPKERAELTMIIDVERNDLGRVAQTGSVRVSRAPHVVSLPSVFHRQATVEARVPAALSRTELFRALLPSGSVTGAPKRRAMQLIRDLEPHRRGLYTGAVGMIQRDGGVELSMAIRTLVVRGGIGHYFSGGGIVADSDPAREVEETRWKAERVMALIAQSSGGTENWSD